MAKPRMARAFDTALSVWAVAWIALFAVYIHAGALAFAGLMPILGAAGLLRWMIVRDVPLRPALPALFVFALFFAWLAWRGQATAFGAETAWRLAVLVAFCAAVPALILTRGTAARRTLAHILMASSLAGLVVLALDVASGYAISQAIDPSQALKGDVMPAGVPDINYAQGQFEMNIGRGHVVYALALPLLFALFATWLPKGRAWLAAIVAVVLLVIGTQLNRLSVPYPVLLGALPLFWAALRRPRLGLGLSLGTAVLSVLLAPLVGLTARFVPEAVMGSLPMSWDHRLRMWDYSLSRIMEAPLTGLGLDASRSMDASFTTRIGVDVPFISLHPHNIGLQTWMEAGAIGALLFAYALALLYKPLVRLCADDPWRAAAASGTIMGAAVASAITVGAWQYWWWALIALLVILVSLVRPASLR